MRNKEGYVCLLISVQKTDVLDGKFIQVCYITLTLFIRVVQKALNLHNGSRNTAVVEDADWHNKYYGNTWIYRVFGRNGKGFGVLEKSTSVYDGLLLTNIFERSLDGVRNVYRGFYGFSLL